MLLKTLPHGHLSNCVAPSRVRCHSLTLEYVACLRGQEEEDTDMGEHEQFQPQTGKWPFL